MTKRDAQAREYAAESVGERTSRSLTLTDDEREAIKTAVGAMCIWMTDNNVTEDESMRRAVLAIRDLLKRTK
jgi:hypothetical protein